MPLQKEIKSKLITDYHRHDSDTGSPEVQIALMTGRIQQLTDHLRANEQEETVITFDGGRLDVSELTAARKG